MFTFDPSVVSASIEVFPKGDYEFIIGKPKSFLKQSGEDKHDSYGVRFPLRIAQPSNYEGKKTVYSTYLQSEGGQAFAKQFMLAALGYGKGRSEEERFDREMAGKDWNINPEDGSVGEAWAQLEDQRIIGSLDKQPNINKPEEEMQQFTGWRSINSGPLK